MHIYIHIYIYIYIYPIYESFPGLISVARTTDVIRVVKAPGVELCQNACGVLNEQKLFCSHQCSPECSMNKFRRIYPQTRICIYIYIYTIQYIEIEKHNTK